MGHIPNMRRSNSMIIFLSIWFLFKPRWLKSMLSKGWFNILFSFLNKKYIAWWYFLYHLKTGGYGLLISHRNGNFIKICSVRHLRDQYTMLFLFTVSSIDCVTLSKSLNISMPALIYKVEILTLSPNLV